MGVVALVLVTASFQLQAQERPQFAPPTVSPLLPSATDQFQPQPGEDLIRGVPPPAESTPGQKPQPVEIRPVLPPPPAVFDVQGPMPEGLEMFVKQVRFKGDSTFPEKKLQEKVAGLKVAGLKGEKVSVLDIERARHDLTQLYVEAEYINSGAIIEEQNFKDGVLVFTLVKGRLTDIKVNGNRWFRTWWLKHIARRSAGCPLNIKKLRQGLELLRQDPNIQQVNAELVPGGKPGESALELTVKENRPFVLGMEFSNRRPPSVGAEILEINASTLNLTGHGDPLTLRYGPFHTTSEKLDRWEWDGDGNIDGTYRFPITPWKTTLELHAGRNDSSIVEEAFRVLDIQSRSTQYGLTLRQPLYETVKDEFALSVTGDYRTNETFLLDRPFSLSKGAIDGKTKESVLRIGAEYIHSTTEDALAVRSTFNIGIDALDATRRKPATPGTSTNPVERMPDGEFFSWLGQAQYTRRLFDNGTLGIIRGNLLLSNGPVLALEQFSLGGSQSVRGYRENELLRDNGAFGSIEVRVPVLGTKEKKTGLLVVPFFDVGVGWDNTEYVGPKPKKGIDRREDILASLGLGLIYSPNKHFRTELYWGYGLNRAFIHKDGDNLQDYGLHFSMSAIAF